MENTKINLSTVTYLNAATACQKLSSALVRLGVSMRSFAKSLPKNNVSKFHK